MSNNAGLKKLSTFTRFLLGYEGTQTVLIGRGNWNRTNFTALQIILDNLGTANRLGSFSSYDGVAEIMRYTHKISAPVTIDFYGDAGNDECERFKLLLSSQEGLELQRDLSIEVYQESGIIDLKELTGEQYSQRVQITLNIQYNITLSKPLLRIDTYEGTIITDP